MITDLGNNLRILIVEIQIKDEPLKLEFETGIELSILVRARVWAKESIGVMEWEIA